MLEAQMLAPIIPAHIHQLDRIKRAASLPWRPGGMRALALEQVFDRHEARVRARAPRDLEIVAHVREDHAIDVLEISRALDMRLPGELFFRDTRPKFDRAG